MTGLILICAVLVILAISVLWGFLRGLGKARIRGISILVCSVAAVLVTLLLKNQIATMNFVNWLVSLLESNQQSGIAELLGFSETLNEVILKCAASLVAPLLCLSLFFLFSFITWFVFLIVTLILNAKLRSYNERCKFSRTRAMIWGFVQGLAIVIIILIPVSAYVEAVPAVTEAVVESNLLGESGAEIEETIEKDVNSINNNGLIVVYRTLGGRALSQTLTDFEINGNRAHLTDELSSVSKFACDIFSLTQTEIANYGAAEAAVFKSIASSFEGSVLLPTIAGEFIYGATDAWINEREFVGVAKPSLGDMSEIFDPFINKLLLIMNTDARQIDALKADINTVADLVATMAEKGIFANLSNTEDLMNTLGGDGTVTTMINILGQNNSMKVLIPEMTNIGVRAIATTLGIPADAEEVYAELMNDIADTLNDIRDLPDAERIETLSNTLVTSFDEAGIPIDKEIIDSYSISMIEDLLESNEAELTGNDVQAFFALYALNVAEELENSNDPTGGLAATGTLPLDALTDLLAGTVYEGKSEEELKNSGAAVLAEASKLLSQMEEHDDPEVVASNASAILQATYGTLLSGKEASMSVITGITVTKPLTTSSVQATASLQSSNDMKEVSVKVTLADLLIDTDAAAEQINEETLEKESAAISAIFTAAKDLTKQTSGETSDIKLSEVAGSVGNILDSLNETASFGSDKTGKLFTAVLQSETVRTAADMDMATATQMAEKATTGNGNYSQTMGAVSSGMELFTKLGNDNENLTDEEIEELIRNINPQTAGMIEVYVTEDRIMKYGVSAEYAGTSASLLSTTFSFMADATMDEAQYKAESAALNHILTIAISAKSHSSGEQLFGGILPSATDTVNSLMSSHALAYSLRVNMLDENGEIAEGKFDVFHLSNRIPETSEDYIECVNAMKAYYEDHPTEETAQTMKAVSALLGVAVDAE